MLEAAGVTQLDHQQHSAGVKAGAEKLQDVGVARDRLHPFGILAQLGVLRLVHGPQRLLDSDLAAAEGAAVDGAERALTDALHQLDVCAVHYL